MDCTEVRKRMFNEMLLFWGNHTHRDVESINDTDWHGNLTPFALRVPSFNQRAGGAGQAQSMQDTLFLGDRLRRWEEGRDVFSATDGSF